MSLRTIVDSWIAAFNDHDVDRIVALYSPDAVHYSPNLMLKNPSSNGLVSGHDEMRVWWQSSFDSIKGLRYEYIQTVEDTPHIFFEYIRHADNEPDRYVGEWFRIEHGLIIRSRVFNS